MPPWIHASMDPCLHAFMPWTLMPSQQVATYRGEKAIQKAIMTDGPVEAPATWQGAGWVAGAHGGAGWVGGVLAHMGVLAHRGVLAHTRGHGG